MPWLWDVEGMDVQTNCETIRATSLFELRSSESDIIMLGRITIRDVETLYHIECIMFPALNVVSDTALAWRKIYE